MALPVANEAVVLGVDVGGTKITASTFDARLRPLMSRTVPTPSACQPAALHGVERGSEAEADVRRRGREALLATIVSLCHDLLWQARSVQAIGIGTAGQVDVTRGVIVEANDNLVGAKGTPLREVISHACGLPVFVDNDVRAMALAELKRGAAFGCQAALCVTVGTGIGGALIRNGEVWHGAHFCAGEIGYVSLGEGHTLESLYSGPAIARRFNVAHGTSYTLTQIAEQAAAGDAACAETICAAASGLGRALASLAALLDPEVLVVGGGVPEIGALWWNAFVAAFRAEAISAVRDLSIRPAAFGTQASALGAAMLAAYHQGLLV